MNFEANLGDELGIAGKLVAFSKEYLMINSRKVDFFYLQRPSGVICCIVTCIYVLYFNVFYKFLNESNIRIACKSIIIIKIKKKYAKAKNFKHTVEI